MCKYIMAVSGRSGFEVLEHWGRWCKSPLKLILFLVIKEHLSSSPMLLVHVELSRGIYTVLLHTDVRAKIIKVMEQHS